MEQFTVPTAFTESLEKVCLPMGLPAEEYLRAAGDADFIIADAMGAVPGDLIRAMPNLKLIHSEGVGYNLIDLEAARERNVWVCNCPGMNAEAVAEQAVLLMSGLLKDVLRNDEAVREGRQIDVKEGYMRRADLKQLSDCSVGLLGFGAIGRATAKLLRAYGSEIFCHKRTPLTAEEEEELGVCSLPLDEMLMRCDIISLHLPVTPETENMCDDAFFAKMKRGSYFVNTARGELVDSEALVRAMEDGTVAMAGLDTLDHEPVGKDHVLLNASVSDRILFSPHIGGVTATSFRRGYEMTWSDIQKAAEGKEPDHRV